MAAKEKKMSKEKEAEFLEKCMKRLKMAIDADNHNRTAAIEDLKFINGDMWDSGEKQQRSLDKRPCLQINLLNKFLNQIVGEQRQNRVMIKVRPEDGQADEPTAKIIAGLVAKIQHKSKFKVIGNFAFDQCVKSGYGAWEVLTRKTPENPFEKEIYLRLLKNPFVVYLDPEPDDPDEAMWGFVITKMNKDEFEEKYPGFTKPDDFFNKGQGIGSEHWYDKDTVTVARYYVRESEKKKRVQMSDGEVMDEDKAKEIIASWQKTYNDLKKQGQEVSKMVVPSIIREDEEECYKVKCYTVTAFDVLDEKDWPGSMIPLVLMTGRETNIEGKRYIKGFVRDAKDPQKLFNYWYTSAAEHIALAPKSPWVASAKMIEGYESDYLQSNTRNIPVLKAKHDPNFPRMMPQRQPPVQPPAAMFQAINDARQNIHDSIGMANRDVMGQAGPERSGIAIRQAQMPADIGTMDIFEHYADAVERTGRIIVDMIPNVYDTDRDVTVRNVDETEQFVPVNTNAKSALERMQKEPNKFQGMNLEHLKNMMNTKGGSAHYNSLKFGKYGVVIDTGPATSTLRQEAGEKFMQLLQTPMGSLLERIAPDLVIKNFDFLEADEFARRAKKILPAGLVEPKPGDPPSKPLPPAPAVQLMMAKSQTEQAKQKTQQVALQVKLVQLYKETKETDTEVRSQILEILNQLYADKHPADFMEGPQGEMSQMQKS
jgi:hypothetical protein